MIPLNNKALTFQRESQGLVFYYFRKSPRPGWRGERP